VYVAAELVHGTAVFVAHLQLMMARVVLLQPASIKPPVAPCVGNNIVVVPSCCTGLQIGVCRLSG
jgi:hypothetical protein